MRVLGVDPGTIRTGYAVVEGKGSRCVPVHYGCVTNRTTDRHSQRFLKIHRELSEAIRTFAPDGMAIESAFFCKNPKTAMLLGEARGVVILAGTEAGLPIWEYSPRRVKQSVVGYGNAHKSQIQKMVKNLLGLPVLPEPEDAADALAIAICHIQMASGVMGEGKQI